MTDTGHVIDNVATQSGTQDNVLFITGLLRASTRYADMPY